MKLSVELSYYPFQPDPVPAIKSVIAHLNSYDDIAVTTFPTATIIIGEFDRVMDVLKNTIAWSYTEYGRCIFVAKFLPNYEATAQ